MQISPQQLITARTGDAVVLTATPGDDVVYIDLGYDDKILPGITFEVYSHRKGVEASEGGRLRGKARIEVISVNADSGMNSVSPIEK